MTKRIFIWLDKNDVTFSNRCRAYGIRALARDAEIEPGQLSRWLRSKCGLAEDKYAKINLLLIDTLAEVRP
jgi:hypothetical protein